MLGNNRNIQQQNQNKTKTINNTYNCCRCYGGWRAPGGPVVRFGGVAGSGVVFVYFLFLTVSFLELVGRDHTYKVLPILV